MSENALDIFVLESIEDDIEEHQVRRMKSQVKKDDPLRDGSVIDWIARQGGIDQREFDIELNQNNMIMKKAKELTEKYM